MIKTNPNIADSDKLNSKEEIKTLKTFEENQNNLIKTKETNFTDETRNHFTSTEPLNKDYYETEDTKQQSKSLTVNLRRPRVLANVGFKLKLFILSYDYVSDFIFLY